MSNLIPRSDYLSLSAAGRLLPNNPSPPSVCRWATKGVCGVRLETRFFGSRLYTTTQWLDRFGKELAEAKAQRLEPAPAPPAPRGRTRKQRQRDLDDAKKTLAADGI